MNHHRSSYCRAFTLNELIIVVSIMGILAVISVPQVRDSLVRARIAQTQNDLRILSEAIETFALDNGHYPLGSSELPNSQLVTNYDTQKVLKPLLGTYLPDNPQILEDYFTSVALDRIDNDVTFDRDFLPDAFGYGYYDYAHFMVPPRFPIRGYGIISFGPDCTDSGLGLRPLAGIGDFVPHAAYNPSNGLMSEGDLGRFGGNISFPRTIP